MKKTAQASSTTLRLRELQVRRVKTALFFSGLFAFLLVIYGFCFLNESAYSGSANIFTFWNEVERHVSLQKADTGILPLIKYTMEIPGRAPKTIDATMFVYFTILSFIVLGLLHGLIGLLSKAAAKGRIQKQLEPLYSMARVTLELSDESNMASAAKSVYSDEKIHDLESAIDSLSPDKPNASLRTGDSDLKGLEVAINSLLRRTRESYSQQIRFVSDASHELRTPIAVVKGYADMLDRWGKDDEKILEESISAIKTEAEHMNTLVEQLLFLARGDSGRTKLTMEDFSLSDMMREVYEESIMIDSGHSWEIAAQDEVIVNGDIAMLKQAVRILVDNAAKYTPAGETVVLRAMYDEKNVPTVVVQDSGIGISAEDLSHIFERFYRSDPARSREQGGTGLGLAIAKWIVDRHNGYLDVFSREGFGTRISIHLPKASAAII